MCFLNIICPINANRALDCNVKYYYINVALHYNARLSKVSLHQCNITLLCEVGYQSCTVTGGCVRTPTRTKLNQQHKVSNQHTCHLK